MVLQFLLFIGIVFIFHKQGTKKMGPLTKTAVSDIIKTPHDLDGEDDDYEYDTEYDRDSGNPVDK